MPNKIRTRKSAAKRFKITPTGKVMHRGQGSRHLKSAKSKKQLRHLNKPKALSNNVFAKRIKRMLGK